MKLPAFAIRPLLRLHAWGSSRPYFDLPGYMLRGWVLGYHSAARNHDNATWHGRTRGRLHAALTARIAIRAHTILRSDSDRAQHDHPVDSISIVLSGGYWEVGRPPGHAQLCPLTYRALLDYLPEATDENAETLALFNVHWRGPGAIVFRRAEDSHRLVLPTGAPPARTLWLIGRKRRSWGFHAPDGWVHWREYLGVDRGEVA